MVACVLSVLRLIDFIMLKSAKQTAIEAFRPEACVILGLQDKRILRSEKIMAGARDERLPPQVHQLFVKSTNSEKIFDVMKQLLTKCRALLKMHLQSNQFFNNCRKYFRDQFAFQIVREGKNVCYTYYSPTGVWASAM